MRKVIFGGANSLDNYFARSDESVDWIRWDDEVAALIAENWKSFDTMLMGRKTYEFALKSGRSGSWGLKTYVFSRTLQADPNADVEIISDNAVAFVRDLKTQEGKDICLMGGGELAKCFFDADLIDEIGFNIHPVLLGSGIPLFHAINRQIDLELLECRPFKNGCVLVKYRVHH
ncbi:MAG TPA: dihydrofolate reductase family protein [Chthonomonadaceae bacterium]|nr:dihydrofolate reductase family protein [Chthonomonadaceae bacterium]